MDLITQKEAANLLGLCSQRAAERLRSAGVLPVNPLGERLFPRNAVEELARLEEQARAAVEATGRKKAGRPRKGVQNG